MTQVVDRAVVRELVRLGAGEEEGRLRVYPFALAVANLLFSAAFEGLIRLHVQGHYLHLFFFVETCALGLCAAGAFLSREREIIARTAVMPLSDADRFAAVTLRLAGRRSVAALVASTSLFAALEGGGRPLATAAALGSYLLGAALTVSGTSLVCLTVMRSSRASLALVVMCGAAAGGVLLASIWFDATRLLAYVPVSSWVARAVLAGAAGSGAGALAWIGILAAALAAVVAAGCARQGSRS